jgi:hypothetical protein
MMAATNSRGETYTRTYGALLLACALLSLLVAAHHPGPEAHDAAGMLRALAARSGMIEGVHGALLAIFAIELAGWYGFARLLGIHRPLAAAGLILMGLGGVAMIAAGTINGFAVPSFASAYANASPADAAVAAKVLRLCWALNQALASLGAVAMGGAILLWSLALIGRGGSSRLVGLGGAIAALAIAGGIVSGLLHLHVGGFILFTALLSLWTAAVALLMLTGRLEDRVAGED